MPVYDLDQVPKLVPGRSCGQCSMCCKLPRIDELEKPANTWCSHCAPGRGGCTIYERRPSECRDFHCSWLLTPELGPEWQPLSCKMMVIHKTHHTMIGVDPGHPTAWRNQPYYNQLKEWARWGVDARPRKKIVVYVRNRIIVVLPNKEVDLGVVAPDQQTDACIMVRELSVPFGRDWEAYIAPAKDVF